MFFFFQAEDGIRDLTVTGVQTCALPISEESRGGAGFAVRLAREQVAHERRDDRAREQIRREHREDRKSTRLNSSHSQISYAVFCLKKKKNKIRTKQQYNNKVSSK